MKLEDFYKSVKQNNITEDLIIFKNSENNFLSSQYIKEICKQHKLIKVDVEDINLIKTSFSVFDSFTDPELQVLTVDKFECKSDYLTRMKNVVVVCNSIDKSTDKVYNSYIISIPKLEDWQIKDFIYTQLEGFTEADVDKFYNTCGKNIIRINTEIERLKLFDEKERRLMFNKFALDGLYEDLDNSMTFGFVDAIVTRNKNKITEIYSKLRLKDISPMGIVQLLYNNFKNVIMVQYSKDQTAEACGLKPNQFWAVKYRTGYYTHDELINVFLLITGIDKKLKTGELSSDMILDYLLINIV